MKRLAGALAVLLMLMLAGCGGTAGVPATGSTTTGGAVLPPPPTLNVATVTLDRGPPALAAGSNGYSAFNEPYVTITICAPGSTTNCQTIDHIILDTGSVGLRIITPAINPMLFALLPTETGATQNPVGECYQYVNSYAFGSVRKADLSIAGEQVASIPFQAIADTGVFATVPASCSSGGGSPILTVQDFGANGILGVGTTTTDCGAQCTVPGGTSGATYFDCPPTGCATTITRVANPTAPFQQLPNPVAAFAADNNGTIIALPAVPQQGVTALTGTVTFGIGTQADNTMAATTVLPLSTSSSRLGPGVLTATYNGKALTQSFFDSGSNEYFFIDTGLAPCTTKNLTAFYCPPAPVTIAPVLTAANGFVANISFTLYSPLDVAGTSTVAPGLAINPTLVVPPLPFANSFDFGVPFFFGRTVYTAIEGRPAGNVVGPYVAF